MKNLFAKKATEHLHKVIANSKWKITDHILV